MGNMKHFRQESLVRKTSLVLSLAMVFNMAVPTVLLAQGTNEYYSTEASLNKVDSCTTDPIDTKNGNNFFQEKRILVPCPGDGLDLELNLKYQSVADLPNGTLGEGWRHSFEWSLDVQYDQAVLYTGDGEEKVFEETVGGGYLSPKASNWTLDEAATGYEVGLSGGLAYVFDSSGRLDSLRDAWNNGLACSYETNGCLETVTHSNGRQLVFLNEWCEAVDEWRVAEIQVQGGESLLFDYNSDGQLTRVLEQVGSTTYTSLYQYAEGFLTNKANGAGFEYTFGYEQEGSVLNGKGTYLAVDGYNEHEVEYIDPDTTDVCYYLRGTEQVYRYARDGNGILTAKYGPGENVSEAMTLGVDYSYAANNEDKTEETLFDNTTGATWSEWMLYDDRHNATNNAVSYCTTNPVLRLSTEFNSVWQLPSAFVDAEGFREETVYTNGSPLIEKSFYSGSNSYDTCYSYATTGLMLAVTNANNHVVEYGYDSWGNRISVVPELGSVTTNTYNSLGFVSSTEILSENRASTGRITQYDNDAKGRVVQTTYADGLTSSNTYNALGYLLDSIDRAGRRTDNTYLPGKNLTSVTRYLSEGGSNTPVRIGYDLDKQYNLLKISEPRGRYVESYQLDIQDRVTSITNIEGQVMTMDYTVGDFVSQTERFDGSAITNTYDNVGQKESVTYNPGGASPVAINYSYWPDGELKAVSDSFSSISNSFDRLNRLTNVNVQASGIQYQVSNAFDPVENLTNCIVTIGGVQVSATSYEYDAAERRTGIIATTGTNETHGFVYSYSPVNGLVSGISNTVSGITCTYQYNVMDHVTNMTYRAGNGSLIRSLEYGYDDVGMITEKKIAGGASDLVQNYLYDSLDRLVCESASTNGHSLFDIHYSYELAGNRLSKTENGIRTSYTLGNGNRLSSATVQAVSNSLFIAGSANELIGTDPRWGELWITNLTAASSAVPSVNGSSFLAEIPAVNNQTNSIHAAIRDRAGNMGYVTKDYWVGLAAGATNGTQSYAYSAAGCLTNLNGIALDWDERYRLKNIEGITYEYDVLDRRVSRTEGGVTNYFVYDDQQVVADLDGSGNILRTYVWGSGIDNLLCFTDHTTSNTYYAIKDHQNTVIALVDETGSVVESYEYDAYGNTKVFNASGVELTESATGNRYCFQGREIDWVTGLYYFRARWYNPDTGRWLSKDPIGISGGLNQYVFCGNNPVCKTDPNGKFSIALVIGVVLAVAAVATFVGLMIDAAQTADQAFEAGDEMRDLQDSVANGEDIPEGAIGDAQDGIRDALKETEDLAVDMFKDRVKSVPCPE